MAELRKHHEFWLALLTVVLFVGLAWHSDELLTFDSLYDPANSYAILTTLACGLSVVSVFGGTDISPLAITIIMQYDTVLLLQEIGGNFAVALTLTGGIDVLLGLINALLASCLRMPSIIIIISALSIFYSLLLWLGRGVRLYDFPPWFEQGVILFKYIDADGHDYGLGLSLITMITVVLLTAFIMNFISVGHKIYVLDGNRESASRIGSSVLKLQLFVYDYMGLMPGAADVVQSWTVMVVVPDSLLGYRLTVLAAVVLDGISLLDRRGTLIGTLLGVVSLIVMQNGLNLLGISSYWQTLVTGIIIVASISATTWGQRQDRSLLWKNRGAITLSFT